MRLAQIVLALLATGSCAALAAELAASPTPPSEAWLALAQQVPALLVMSAVLLVIVRWFLRALDQRAAAERLLHTGIQQAAEAIAAGTEVMRETRQALGEVARTLERVDRAIETCERG